jgi:hypothetical protein
MRSVFRLGMACFGLLLTACPSDQDPLGTGELGKGDLRVACATDDAACAPGAESLDSSVPIAVGAAFRVTYDGPVPKSPAGGLSTMVLFSGSPAMLSKDEDQFIAWMPGSVAVLARTEQGTVTDFVHLFVSTIERVGLASSEEKLVVGKQKVWQATPFGPQDTVLAGSLAYAWEVVGTAAEVVSAEGRSVTLVAKEPGEATLRALSGEAVGEAKITVEVAP